MSDHEDYDDSASEGSEHSDEETQQEHEDGEQEQSAAEVEDSREKAAREERNKEILVERTVIHEALIRNAIHKDLKTYYDVATIPPEQQLDFADVSQLVLSFRSIYAIDNLQGFEHLTKLQLDNNMIQRIESLDHLVNLTWLDLSFNKITRIEGLSKLTKLTDLSLFDNQITQIEGLDNLVNLNVLSLGNNGIRDLSQVKDLRKFKHLRLLNLKGNPVCQHDDYHNTVFAYLTGLKYLDYVVIEAAQFARARDAKLDQILVLEQKEKQQEMELKERAVVATEQQQLNAANLEGLSTLFADMIRADVEHPKIKVLPGFDKLHAAYKAAFEQVIADFSAEILTRHQIKATEKKMFDEVVAKVNGTAEEESVAAIESYDAKKKVAFRQYQEALDRSELTPDVLHKLKLDLAELSDTLMDIEMLLVEQMAAILEEFEKTYLKLITENVLKIGTCFRSLMDVSNKHLSGLYDLTHSLLEKYTKDENFTDDVDVKAILSDKDVLNNAVSSSHENQDARILQMEDVIREREEGNGKQLIKELRKKEYQRNRKRVAEIYELRAREEAQIDEKLEAEEPDDEDLIKYH